MQRYVSMTVADVMATSRANIDALYKRAKDQMARAFAQGEHSTARREADPRLLTPAIQRLRRDLLDTSPPDLNRALLQPATKERAVMGLVMSNYDRFKVSLEEMEQLARGADPLQVIEEVLGEAVAELGL